MAIRVIRTEEDPVLRKISKPVKEVTPKIITLIDDMLDTMDEEMNEVIYEGTELLARAFCHEIDHLDGKMYTDLVEGELHRTSYEED